MLGREQRRDPAVGDLRGQRRVLRPDRRDVDRDALLHRSDRELERLARPVGQRQLQRLAVVAHAFAAQRHPHDLDVLARPLQLAAEALPVPALCDLRPARADAQQHAAAGELVERRRGHRGHRRRAAGHLEDRRAELDALGLGREPGEDRDRVGAVGLGGPDRVVAEPLGLLDELELLGGAEPEAPVADVDAELHAREGNVAEGEREERAARLAGETPYLRLQLVHKAQQPQRRERLGEEQVGARRGGIVVRAALRNRGEHHDRRVGGRGVRAQPPARLDPVEPRHVVVEEHDLGPLVQRGLDRRHPVGAPRAASIRRRPPASW